VHFSREENQIAILRVELYEDWEIIYPTNYFDKLKFINF